MPIKNQHKKFKPILNPIKSISVKFHDINLFINILILISQFNQLLYAYPNTHKLTGNKRFPSIFLIIDKSEGHQIKELKMSLTEPRKGQIIM